VVPPDFLEKIHASSRPDWLNEEKVYAKAAISSSSDASIDEDRAPPPIPENSCRRKCRQARMLSHAQRILPRRGRSGWEKVQREHNDFYIASVLRHKNPQTPQTRPRVGARSPQMQNNNVSFQKLETFIGMAICRIGYRSRTLGPRPYKPKQVIHPAWHLVVAQMISAL
jgi:hypothetical protein